jgi:uridine phosphorylase
MREFAAEKTICELQSLRYQEWLQAAQSWVFGEPELTPKVGPYLILVHSSQGNPEKHLLPRLANIKIRGEFVQGHGSAYGEYKGTGIWLLHHPMGSSSAQFWMECLHNTRVRAMICLGEMTSYPDDVHVGDIVLVTSAIRGDLVTNYHAPDDMPACCDQDLLEHMQRHLDTTNWPVHVGPVYSGMPGGIGVDNPILKEKVWRHLQAGMLGNAMETSVVYLEAARLGIRIADAWSVSDDIAHGYWNDSPDGWKRWEKAWDLIAWAALETLADISREEENNGFTE